ncbi:hypothetical protein ACB098_12G041000 [Castanea mollissima]
MHGDKMLTRKYIGPEELTFLRISRQRWLLISFLSFAGRTRNRFSALTFMSSSNTSSTISLILFFMSSQNSFFWIHTCISSFASSFFVYSVFDLPIFSSPLPVSLFCVPSQLCSGPLLSV